MLVTMEYRQPRRSAGNLHGVDDDARPHDEQMEDAWITDARAAVVKKAMLGCEVTDDELSIAGLTLEDAKKAADRLMRRTETEHKRLTEPPEPAEPQRARVYTHTVDVEPEPEPAAPSREPVRPKQKPMSHLTRRAMDMAKQRLRDKRGGIVPEE